MQSGESNNNAKLTAQTVKLIKALYREGHTPSKIGAFLGVSRLNIWNIVHGVSWQHVVPDSDFVLPEIPLDVLPAEKLCPKCKVVKALNLFPKRSTSPLGVTSWCKECKNETEYERRLQDRKHALSLLGGRCACCGESQFEFLAIDHINNDGGKERKETGNRNIFIHIARGKADLTRYQVLCHNCNCAKGFYGECPHKRQTP